MRDSLIVLAVVGASLPLIHAAHTRRTRRALLLASARGPRSRSASGGRSGSSRSVEWRYYGFSSRGVEADTAAAETPIVAGSPAVGSVVSILPDDSVAAVVNGRVYWKSGSVWYEPQSTGPRVTY